MKYIDRIKTFKPELQEIFVKMILGINVEITDEERNSSALYENTGRWFFIKSIEDEESITIVSQNHHIFSGLTYKSLKLRTSK